MSNKILNNKDISPAIDIVDLTTIVVGDFIKYCSKNNNLDNFKKMNFSRRKKIVDQFITHFMSKNSSKITI